MNIHDKIELNYGKNMVILNIILYVLAYVAIWWGAGLIIKSLDKVARRLRLSSFAISFLVLGILTSIPEMGVGINAITENNPEIFVGTLLGGVIVIFLFVIPVLAILGRGIRINHDLNNQTLLMTLAVAAMPGLLVIDHRVTSHEGLFLILCYGALVYIIEKKHGIFDKNITETLNVQAYTLVDLLKVILGITVVFISSNFIVDQTIAFSKLIHISTFYISLLALSLGTNLPELSIAIRAVLSGKKDIAFGDYLGSAAANTLLFGLFTLISNGEVLTVNNFLMTFWFIVSGIGLFFYASQSKRDISVKEGAVLFLIYIIFLLYEMGRAFQAFS